MIGIALNQRSPPDPPKDFVELPCSQRVGPLLGGSAASAPDKGEKMLVDGSRRDPPVGSFRMVTDQAILKLVEQAKGRNVWVHRPFITAMVTEWECLKDITVPGKDRKDLGPFRTIFAVHKGSVILFQPCIRTSELKSETDSVLLQRFGRPRAT